MGADLYTGMKYRLLGSWTERGGTLGVFNLDPFFAVTNLDSSFATVTTLTVRSFQH